MAVVLRCPDCRTKLRLEDAPAPGDEVECPKCGTAFPAPDPDADDDLPAKKRRPRGDGDAPPRKKKPKPPPAAGPKKRRAKAKKSNPYILVGAAIGGLLFVSVMGFGLFYLLGRKPAAVEMMAYLPDDADHAYGVNLTQFQKYTKFYEDMEAQVLNLDVKQLDWLSKALGGSYKDLYDYQLKGWKGGWQAGKTKSTSVAWVMRTKKEFDPEALGKIPGARAGTAGSLKAFDVPPDPSTGREAIKVFAPTNRIVVIAPASTPPGTLGRMAGGNADDPSKTIGGRMGDLGARTIKGNLWCLALKGEGNKGDRGGAGVFDAFIPVPDVTKGGADVVSALTPKGHEPTTNGTGFRASIGAKEVRFEVLAWESDAEKAKNLVKDKQYEELSKGDEAESPPKWWKEIKNGLGEKKVGLQMESNMSISASGELFIVQTKCDAELVKQNLGSYAGRFRPGTTTN